MKYVGEAMADLNQAGQDEGTVRAPLIGIATHNVVHGREELIEPTTGTSVSYRHTKGEPGKMSTALDFNHTHFWLVDDGSGASIRLVGPMLVLMLCSLCFADSLPHARAIGCSPLQSLRRSRPQKEKFGVEIKLRNQFEEALSRSQYKSTFADMPADPHAPVYLPFTSARGFVQARHMARAIMHNGKKNRPHPPPTVVYLCPPCAC